MEEFRRLKANKIWNRKTFKKLFKFGNLRIYIMWNLRLKARNKRDDILVVLKLRGYGANYGNVRKVNAKDAAKILITRSANHTMFYLLVGSKNLPMT